MVVADPANSAKLTSTKPSYREDKKKMHITSDFVTSVSYLPDT